MTGQFYKQKKKAKLFYEYKLKEENFSKYNVKLPTVLHKYFYNVIFWKKNFAGKFYKRTLNFYISSIPCVLHC